MLAKVYDYGIITSVVPKVHGDDEDDFRRAAYVRRYSGSKPYSREGADNFCEYLPERECRFEKRYQQCADYYHCHAPLSKVAATKSYGADIVLKGDFFDDAEEEARRLEKEQGLTFIHPYDDPLVMAGQGTIACEILEQLPETDVIVVPIGGGGLISGISVAAKSIKPSIRVIGVQTENIPSM